MNTPAGPEQSRDPTEDEDEAPVVSNHRQWLLDMCKRKGKPFATWHHAELAAKRTNRNKKGKDNYVAPFICPVCQKIHNGSRPKRIKNKGKNR